MTTTETSRYRGYDIMPRRQWSQWCVSVYPTRSDTPSVAIHSEKSDATKGRCPGRCQEAHRRHSDEYQLDHHLVPPASHLGTWSRSFAPWNLRPSAQGALEISL